MTFRNLIILYVYTTQGRKTCIYIKRDFPNINGKSGEYIYPFIVYLYNTQSQINVFISNLYNYAVNIFVLILVLLINTPNI